MFLKDFRPQAEFSGGGLTTTKEPNTLYNSGNRQDIITITIDTIIDHGGVASSLVSGDNTDIHLSSSNPTIHIELSEKQKIDRVDLWAYQYNGRSAEFFYSEDNINWTSVGSLTMSDEQNLAVKSSIEMELDGAYKYYKFILDTYKGGSDPWYGRLQEIEFNTVSYDEMFNPLPLLKEGQFDFEYSDLTDKKVRFSVLNNSLTTAGAGTGSIDSDYEIFAIEGQRASVNGDDTSIIPGNFIIQTHLDVREKMFASSIASTGDISAAGYLQTALGVVKFHDSETDPNDWRDLLYDGNGRDTHTGAINPGGGLYVENTSDEFEAVVTTENIASICTALGISSDMLKSVYDTNDSGIVDNSELVNGLTVEAAVPMDAIFTDTVYDDTSLSERISVLETAGYITVDNNTTYTLSSDNLAADAANGTITLTDSNSVEQTIQIKGLGSAAYTESTDYATSAQGALADTALQSETTTSLTLVDNTLTYTDETATANEIDLSGYVNISYDQSLNTTDNVLFNNIDATGTLAANGNVAFGIDGSPITATIKGVLNVVNDSTETVLSNGLQQVGGNSIQWYSGNLYFKSGATGSDGDRMNLSSDGSLTISGSMYMNTDNARLRLQRTTGANYIDYNNSHPLNFRSISSTDTDANTYMSIETDGTVVHSGGTKLGNTSATPTVKEMVYSGTVDVDATISNNPGLVDVETPSSGQIGIVTLAGLTGVDSVLTSMEQIIDYKVMIEVESGSWYSDNMTMVMPEKQFVTYIEPDQLTCVFNPSSAGTGTTLLLDNTGGILRNFKIYIKYTV